ncbi:tail fiber protein [Escherichia coli]|nr:tail fiber protein [Escherichia coli]
MLSYLGLGEGSALPVGVPVPWPSATPPTGWIKCNGASFSASQYPKLALVYPSLLLPDLRGEFIRGWDDERGVDVGRAILSSQGDAIRNIDGEIGYIPLVGSTHISGALSTGGAQNFLYVGTDPSKATVAQSIFFNASKVHPTASEVRPRSIAFNYIVRAA